MPAVVFGLVGRVGGVGTQHLALLKNLIRADLADRFDVALQTQLLQQVALGCGRPCASCAVRTR